MFMPFRSFLKLENVSTDNNVFRMHYKATVIMLLVFTLLVTSKQFFGEPIHCMSDSDKDTDKEAVNSYCWIYGTYTLKSRFVGKYYFRFLFSLGTATFASASIVLSNFIFYCYPRTLQLTLDGNVLSKIETFAVLTCILNTGGMEYEYLCTLLQMGHCDLGMGENSDDSAATRATIVVM